MDTLKKYASKPIAMLLIGLSIFTISLPTFSAGKALSVIGHFTFLGTESSSNLEENFEYPLIPGSGVKYGLPLDIYANSPWDNPFFIGGTHGMWIYANDEGRVRTYARSGTSNSVNNSKYGYAKVIWTGHYIRSNDTEPTATINRSWLDVHADNVGVFGLVSREGVPNSPPEAEMSISIEICGWIMGSGEWNCNDAFVHNSRVRGVKGLSSFPLKLEKNRTSQITFFGEHPFNKIKGEYYNLGGGFRFEIPSIEVKLGIGDLYAIDIGEEYLVTYTLWVDASQDSDEHLAEAILGDPLDADIGGITLNTSHTLVTSNIHVCKQTSDPNRFTPHDDGTITDTLTGLMWQRCPAGYTLNINGTDGDPSDDLCESGSDEIEYDWQGALQQADSEVTAGYSDWLVPNIKQLESLVELSCFVPAIDSDAFPDTQALPFWSSTSDINSELAWQISFADGDMQPGPKLEAHPLRLVRNSGAAPMAATPGLIAGNANVTEGDAGTTSLNFPVSLTRSHSSDVTVDYATYAFTATEGDDYLAAMGSLTIPAGELYGNVTVTVNGDTEVENNERLELALSNPSSGVYLGNASSLGTIIDDEVQIDISIATPQQAEGDTGTQSMEFVFTLDKPVVDFITFDYATADDSATAGIDYVAANGNVVMLAGETSASIFVTINGDTQHENDETFTLTLSNVVGGILSDDSPFAAVISDDDGSGAAYQALNDTGVTQCASSTTLDLCPENNFPEQDGDLGRDVSNNDDADGLAGFSFTKLDSSGSPISNQAAVYYFDFYTFSMNSSYAIWDCVKDEITGLIWEVKTDVPEQLRNPEWVYSWYNSTGINDGGSAGVANGGLCVDDSNCDTEKYVSAVNASNLCGFDDWRLPRVDELHSLAVYGSKGFVVDGLDRAYFPHHVQSNTWTATPAALDEIDGAWIINFQAYESDVTFTEKSSGIRIRLVRDDQ